MTSNIYLNDLLHPICESYQGCYSADNIPIVTSKQPQCFIVNLSKQTEPGSHFVALVIREHHVYYFDSFGEKCSNQHILSYMENLSRDIVYNSVKIQDSNSKMCGFYCALIVLRNDKNCTLKSDVSFHSDESKLYLNDKLCVDYICKTVEKINRR